MTTHKLNPTGSTTVDSFEANLIQIEQTNKLLANIENKLNNFFHKNISIPSSLAPQDRDLKDQVYQEQQHSHPSREDFMKNIGNTMLSPIQNNQNKDSLQNFMSGEGELNLKISNNYIKIIDSSKAYETNPSYTEQNSSHNYKARNPTLESNPLTTLENQDFTITDHNTSESRHSIGRDPYNRRKVESGREFHHEKILGNGRKSARYWTKDEEERMEDIDKKFYEKKIQLLEERLENSEKEVYHLLKVKESMNSELIRLKAQLSESHNRYIEDLSKSLKGQEERLRREFEQQLKYKEEDKNEHVKYMDKIESLTKERDILKHQIQDIRRDFEKLKEEKETGTGTARNSRLLSSHDHMGSHVDYQRNERHLKSPSDRLQSEGRVSVAKSQDTRVGSEQFKALVESLNLYKQELENLRENNANIQHQFEQEVHALRNELEHEKEQNVKMAERIQMQNQVLGKYQTSGQETYGRRETHNLSEPIQTIHVQSVESGIDYLKEMNEDQLIHRRHGSVKEPHHEGERHKSQVRKSSSGVNGEHERRSNKRYGRESSANRQEGEERQKREKNEAHSSAKYNKDTKRESIPFTNPNIKSGLMGQERKGRAREALYKELAELQSTPPRINSARAKSRSNSKSNSKRRKASEDQPMKIKNEVRFQQLQKSPGTAYEEFEEELKKLKGALNAKVSHKKKKSRIDKENILKKETANVRDKFEKPEKRLSATSSRGLSKKSSCTTVSSKPALAMSAKNIKKKI